MSEANDLLLSRWQGAKDLINGIASSFEGFGECRRILERLEKKEITSDEASSAILAGIERIHQKTHNYKK